MGISSCALTALCEPGAYSFSMMNGTSFSKSISSRFTLMVFPGAVFFPLLALLLGQCVGEIDKLLAPDLDVQAMEADRLGFDRHVQNNGRRAPPDERIGGIKAQYGLRLTRKRCGKRRDCEQASTPCGTKCQSTCHHLWNQTLSDCRYVAPPARRRTFRLRMNTATLSTWFRSGMPLFWTGRARAQVQLSLRTCIHAPS